MATTSKAFTIFLVFASILASIEGNVYDIHSCGIFGGWQHDCAGPGTVACDDAYLSDAYCISKCYSNVCSNADDAARGYKEYLCKNFGVSVDYVRVDGQLSLAIQRRKDSSCATYENTYDFVPNGALY